MLKNKNSEQGIAHLLLIVLVVAVVGLIGFAGWRVSSKNKTSGSGSGVASVVTDKQVESACLKEVNDKDLCKFASRYNLDKVSYKAAITSTSSDGTSVSNMEVDGKNNTSWIMTQGGKESMASISLNNDTYIKDESDGTWTRYKADNTTTPKEEKPTSDIKITANDITSKNTITYKSLDKEACGKLTCFKYQVIDSTAPKTTQYLWFDTKDYMMQRWSFKDDNSSSDMVFTYQAVTIKAPSPVHDFDTNSQADMQAAQAAAAAAAAAVSAGSDSGTTE